MSYLHVLSWTPGIQKRWGDRDGKGWTETIPEENQTEVEVCGPHPFGEKDFPALCPYFSRYGRESG